MEEHGQPSRLSPSDLLIFLFLLSLCACLAGCERGCARRWFEERGASEQGLQPPGSQAMGAIDCPDGLARCNGGVVEVSVLARIAQPCRGTMEQCTCRWERAGECPAGCVADELVAVLDRGAATRQLCAPDADAAVPARPLASPPASRCQEEELYRCAGGAIISCADRAVVAVCAKGCATEGASLDVEVPVSREAAFAILCSR